MNLNEYTQAAIRTESLIDNVTVESNKLAIVANLFIHAGNLLDMIKKNAFYGKPIDVEVWNRHMASAHGLSGCDNATLDHTDTDLRTSDLLPVDPRIFHAVVGIATEGTELVEALMEVVSGISTLDTVNLKEEGLGDVCWYQAILADALGADWEQNLETNIAKLRKRYPDKFTSENAINRDLVTEREILETAK